MFLLVRIQWLDPIFLMHFFHWWFQDFTFYSYCCQMSLDSHRYKPRLFDKKCLRAGFPNAEGMHGSWTLNVETM